MKRPGEVMHWVQWDKQGRLVRALYHRPDSAQSAPAAPKSEPESTKVERGVRAAPEPEQDRLL